MPTISILDIRDTLANGYRLPTDAPAAPLRVVHGVLGAAENNDNAIRSVFPADHGAHCRFIASVLRELSLGEVWGLARPNGADTLIQHIFTSHVGVQAAGGGAPAAVMDHHWLSNVNPPVAALHTPFLQRLNRGIFFCVTNIPAYVGEHHNYGAATIEITHPASGIAITVPFDNTDFQNVINNFPAANPAGPWMTALRGGRNIRQMILNLQKDRAALEAAAITAARAVVDATPAIATAAVTAAFGIGAFVAAVTSGNQPAAATRTAAINAARDALNSNVNIATAAVNAAITAPGVPYKVWSISPDFSAAH